MKQIESLSEREHYINQCISNEKRKRIDKLEQERLSKLRELEELKETKQKLLGNIDDYAKSRSNRS